jgi:hypothetical protein
MSNVNDDPYTFELRLDVTDGGRVTTYTVSDSADEEEILAGLLASRIADMLHACVDLPPSGLQLARVMGDPGSKVVGLALLNHGPWSGELEFEDCFKVTVDLDRLLKLSTAEGAEAVARHVCESHDIDIAPRAGE